MTAYVTKDPFVQIESIESLDRFLVQANGSAVVLFKHSDTCGVSSRAFRELSKLRNPVGLISVQTSRTVSDEIERRWKVAHESPQVLIVRDDRVIWDASHFGVKAEAIEAALNGLNDR